MRTKAGDVPDTTDGIFPTPIIYPKGDQAKNAEPPAMGGKAKLGYVKKEGTASLLIWGTLGVPLQ